MITIVSPFCSLTSVFIVHRPFILFIPLFSMFGYDYACCCFSFSFPSSIFSPSLPLSSFGFSRFLISLPPRSAFRIHPSLSACSHPLSLPFSCRASPSSPSHPPSISPLVHPSLSLGFTPLSLGSRCSTSSPPPLTVTPSPHFLPLLFSPFLRLSPSSAPPSFLYLMLLPPSPFLPLSLRPLLPPPCW